MIKLLEVLNLGIELLQVCLHLIQLVCFLTDSNMDARELLVLLLTSISQNLDPSLTLLQVGLKLLDSKLEASNVKVSRANGLLKALNVTVALLRESSGVSQIGLKALDVPLLLIVAALHHAQLSSELGVLFILHS